MSPIYRRDPEVILGGFLGGAVFGASITPHSWLGPIVGALGGAFLGYCDTTWRLR